MDSALVLFSGGQDSTTCLFYALAKYKKVWTLGFSYGQRHQHEISARNAIFASLKNFPNLFPHFCDDISLSLPDFALLNSNALTDPSLPITINSENALPTTFVPARNVIFLSYAAAVLYGKNIDRIVIGVSEADYSGYPDCRKDTLESMQTTLSLALDRPVTIEAPLMHRTKAMTWELAEEIGGEEAIELILHKTHTCYANDHTHWQTYGYGCGQCPSCLLRKKGWEEFCSRHTFCKK